MRLLFAGDVMLGRLVNGLLERRTPEYPWGDTLPVFKSADARFCNLECVISDHGEPWSQTPKYFHFRSDTKNVKVLKAAGIDAASIANNHTLDFEYEAAFEMLKVLDKEGISRAGAGHDYNEASAPAFLKVKDIVVAFIAFTDNEPVWAAYGSHPGIFFVPVDREDVRAKKLFELIKETKTRADIVIVAAHWGPNWGYRPAPEHIPFAHALVDSGADIVFGHSCHVFQGIEIYGGRPIIYSAGDFIDDYAVDEVERNDESFIFVVETTGRLVSRLVLYPTVIKRFQATMADETRAGRIASKMHKLCDEFSTNARWDEKERYLEILL